MPIILNDNNTVSATDVKGVAKKDIGTVYSPKFFHKSVLTGKGGTSKGLLNETRDPKMFKTGYPMSVNPRLCAGSTYNRDIKIYNIPCFIITPDMWKYVNTYKRPETGEMTLIATKGTEEIYLSMPIHALQIEEYQVPMANGAPPATKRDLSACMHMFLFSIKDKTTENHTRVTDMSDIVAGSNTYYQQIVHNIFTELRTVESTLTAHGYTVDKTAMNDFVQNYSLYTELCKASKMWQTETSYYVADVLIRNVNDYLNHMNSNVPDNSAWTGMDSVSDVLSRLEKYNVPLDQYQDMYSKIATFLPADVLSAICKSNLNLRLSNTLKHMDDNRANLNSCPCNNHVVSKIPYSKEQKEAIESTSPLTLVQSGAGTGKSTVILGRIDHMIANGVDPNDITVLSFTNAAANHIKDLKPTIHSMTIAFMLHAIYTNNFPSHQLSSLSTIINSLDIYYPDNHPDRAFIRDFKYILERLRDNNEYTRANNFIEDNIDIVVDILNTIQQTSLELEGIICYQKMDTLVEPPETQTKHLIIDEVQDNSISEFIYVNKYVDKHNCSMYIVGDCSQTLYEFRSSNPKALNVLESSGVFETHKLQTNYRSNQEILDFANVLLGNIEANQYANIQLKANSLKTVTLQSFKDAVSLMYTRLPSKSTMNVEGMLAHSIMFDVKDYINDKLAKGEQVCILAPQRYTLNILERQLGAAYPDKKIASLIPKRQYDSTIFSKFIAKYWDNIKFTPPLHLIDTIERDIMTNLAGIAFKSSNMQKLHDSAVKLIDDFKTQYASTVLNWENQVLMSVMTQDQMLDEVKKLMISFEIRKNAVAQALLSSKNAEAKKAADVDTADFVISTIHSAKGLEFDNVIVYYQSESESTIDEATKRMYYVAFTRAKKTEFIFAYDTMARPKIQGDYERIIKTLTAKAAKSGNAGNPDDTQTVDSTILPVSERPMPLPSNVTNYEPVADENAAGADSSSECSDGEE